MSYDYQTAYHLGTIAHSIWDSDLAHCPAVKYSIQGDAVAITIGRLDGPRFVGIVSTCVALPEGDTLESFAAKESASLPVSYAVLRTPAP